MKTSALIFALSLALILISCGKKSENAVTVEVIDGIEYVHNTEAPANPLKTLSFEEELAIGGEDDEGNIILFEAGFLIVDENENIYITDRRDFNIKVFDKKGTYLRTIGAKGEGPGEFQYIGYIAFLPDERLLVMDFQARRTSLFEPSGEFISSHQWTKWYSQLVLTMNSSYFVQERVREAGTDPFANQKLKIDEISLDGKEIRSFGNFVLAESRRVTQGGITIGMSAPHSPRSIFAGDIRNQCIFHCVNNKYSIEVYDSHGNIFRTIDRPYDPLPYTREDKKEFLARSEGRPDNIKKLVNGMKFPVVKNIAARMLTDDQGNLWIRTNEVRDEGETRVIAYDVFDKDGDYDSKVWLEIHPEIILKGKMYNHYTDRETGYAFIKRYRMIWSD